MKNIDIKSLLIGALLTSTIFLGVAATSPTDKWDNSQEWFFADANDLKRLGAASYVEIGRGKGPLDGNPVRVYKTTDGWEPWVVDGKSGTKYFRRRIK